MPEYSLNVAYRGQHYCRVTLPDSLTDASAAARAAVIAAGIKMGSPAMDAEKFSFELIVWKRVGQEIAVPGL